MRAHKGKTPKAMSLVAALKAFFRQIKDLVISLFAAQGGKRIALSRPLLSVVLVFAAAVSTLGQATGSATLRGRVIDPSGAVIPKLEVTLTNEATKDDRKSRTNDEGIYTFSALNPVIYTLRIEGNGFKSSEQKGVVLSPSDTRGLDIELEVGAQSET